MPLPPSAHSTENQDVNGSVLQGGLPRDEENLNSVGTSAARACKACAMNQTGNTSFGTKTTTRCARHVRTHKNEELIRSHATKRDDRERKRSTNATSCGASEDSPRNTVRYLSNGRYLSMATSDTKPGRALALVGFLVPSAGPPQDDSEFSLDRRVVNP